jgi:O-antigen/teichoic acid export membrane protein
MIAAGQRASSDRPGERSRSGALWTVVAGNVVAALFGLAQGLVVVRALGVADYGAYGMLAAIAAICANALDLRLGDATTRWFYARRGDGNGLAILLAGALGQGLVALVLGLATLAATFALLSRLGADDLPASAVVAFTAGEVLTYAARFLIFSLRLSGRTGDLVRCEVSVAALRSAIVCAVVLLHPSLAGLAAGLALAGAATLVVAAVAFVHAWVVVGCLRTSLAALRLEMKGLLDRRRELVSLNTTNYQNLLHRGADVLVLGLLAGEREAGLYKLARSLTDNLYVLYDAAAKTYQPRLVELFSARRVDELSTFAARTIRVTALAVAVLLAAEAMLLEPLLVALFGPAFAPARVPILLLSAATFFVFGFYLWAWPLIVAERRVAMYAVTALLAVVLGQYVLGIAGALAGIESLASWFAFTYLASYVLLWAAFGPTAAALLRDHDRIAPAVAPAARRP